METNEDIWLGCALGYRVGSYLAGKTDGDIKQLIKVLKEIADDDLTLADPSQNAAGTSAFKDVSQSIGHASIRSDKALAIRAIQQLRNQKDE